MFNFYVFLGWQVYLGLAAALLVGSFIGWTFAEMSCDNRKAVKADIARYELMKMYEREEM